jgi:prevent-host-death family protein
VKLAEKGEAIKISRSGHEVAVLISKELYDQLTAKKDSLLNCFLSAPYPDLELDLSRSKEVARDIDL